MTKRQRVTAVVVGVFAASVVGAGCGEDPVYERCVTERQTYCDRLFVCLNLGTLVGVNVNYEDESSCYTEETRRCEDVSSSNACPGGANSTYDSARHEECIQDQQSQSCSAFAERPTSCSTYCSTN